MRYFLENDQLKIEIDSHGAEVKSVLSKKDYREYMWYGNPKFWGRTSPVLFPFVGSVNNGCYRHNGTEYKMGQHGFARDMEHTLVSQTENEIWFSLTENETSLSKYPFRFELNLGYKLTDNKLEVLWKVKNPSDNGNTEELIFSIGAHPAFLCPIHGENSKEGYKLFFGGVDEIHHHGNTPEGMALEDEDIVIKLDDHCVTITLGFFDRCTYMIEGNQTKSVGIVDPSGRKYITVNFDTPLFAIWSPEGKNAPFICIEPWFGRCDAVGFNGELSERKFENTLTAGEEFNASYEIVFE